jgi:hypothetical protein
MTRPAPESSRTQCGRILGRLIQAHGAEVPLHEILPLAAQYNSRIWSLRKMGFKIVTRTQERDGVRHSFFRLVSSPAQADIPAPRTHSADSQIRAAAPTNSTRREREETLPLFPGEQP